MLVRDHRDANALPKESSAFSSHAPCPIQINHVCLGSVLTPIDDGCDNDPSDTFSFAVQTRDRGMSLSIEDQHRNARKLCMEFEQK